jgi:hypothetical protein
MERRTLNKVATRSLLVAACLAVVGLSASAALAEPAPDPVPVGLDVDSTGFALVFVPTRGDPFHRTDVTMVSLGQLLSQPRVASIG